MAGGVRVLLVGEESAGIRTLKLLREGHHTVVGVMASPGKAEAGGASLWGLAQKAGLRLWPAEQVKDFSFAEVVRGEEVDLLLNVHSLFVIKPEIVMAPRLGSYNLHPGPLPRYAGLNAPSWAIYRGEKSHGVTLHRMLAGIDTGPIAYQALFGIDDSDTGFSLSAKCIKTGIELIRQLLESAATDPAGIPQIEQDVSRREYFGKGTPHDGWVRWDQAARDVVNFVRAANYLPFASPWHQPRSKLGEHEIGFLKLSLTGEKCQVPPGTVGPPESGAIQVACGDEWVIVNRFTVNGYPGDGGSVFAPGAHLNGGPGPTRPGPGHPGAGARPAP